jgi:hypothetical protein
MPCWVILLVKLLFDVGRDVFLNVKLFHSLGSTVNRVLLHVFGHVGILDDSFAISHFKIIAGNSEIKAKALVL